MRDVTKERDALVEAHKQYEMARGTYWQDAPRLEMLRAAVNLLLAMTE